MLSRTTASKVLTDATIAEGMADCGSEMRSCLGGASAEAEARKYRGVNAQSADPTRAVRFIVTKPERAERPCSHAWLTDLADLTLSEFLLLVEWVGLKATFKSTRYAQYHRQSLPTLQTSITSSCMSLIISCTEALEEVSM